VDERTRFFLCVLAGAGGFGGLLALFGGMVGVVSSREGRAGGTVIGLGAARAFARLTDRELPPLVQAALVGAVDGLVFGAALGAVVGTFAGWQYPAEWRVLRPALVTMAALVAAAVGFGLLAGWWTRG
jgi:hypothetical protein